MEEATKCDKLEYEDNNEDKSNVDSEESEESESKSKQEVTSSKSFYLLKLKQITKSGEDGRLDGQCGLVREKSDDSATQGLIPIHEEEAERKN